MKYLESFEGKHYNKSISQLIACVGFIIIALHPQVLISQTIVDRLDIVGKFINNRWLDGDHWARDKDGFYYVLVTGTDLNKVQINGELYPPHPNTDFIHPGTPYTVLLKIDENLELRKAVVGENLAGVAVTDDRVFVKCSGPSNQIIYGDSIWIRDSMNKYVLELNKDMNYLDHISEDHLRLLRTTGTDSLLMINKAFTDGEPGGTGIIYDEVIINNELFQNYQYYSTFGNSIDTSYGATSPIIIAYDYKNDTIRDYWKFGSTAFEMIDQFETTKEGNIFVSGRTYAVSNFTLNNIDTLTPRPLGVKDHFIAEYSTDGTLNYGFVLDEIKYESVWSVSTDDTGVYCSVGLPPSDHVIADSTFVFPEHPDYDITYNTVIIKFDFKGEVIWMNYIPSIGQSVFSAMKVKNGKVYCLGNNRNGTFDIDGIETTLIEEHSIIYQILDAENGQRLKYFIKNGRIDPEILDINDDEEVLIAAKYTFDSEWNGQILSDTPIGLIRFKNDFQSSTSETIDILGTTPQVFPNPITAGENIQLQDADDIVAYELYNIQGQIVQQGDLATPSIAVPNDLQSGIYFLKLLHHKGSISLPVFIE